MKGQTGIENSPFKPVIEVVNQGTEQIGQSKSFIELQGVAVKVVYFKLKWKTSFLFV